MCIACSVRHGQESCASGEVTRSRHLLVALCDLQEVKLVGGKRVMCQLDLGVVDRQKGEHQKREQHHGLGDHEHAERHDEVAQRRPRRLRRSCDPLGAEVTRRCDSFDPTRHRGHGRTGNGHTPFSGNGHTSLPISLILGQVLESRLASPAYSCHWDLPTGLVRANCRWPFTCRATVAPPLGFERARATGEPCSL